MIEGQVLRVGVNPVDSDDLGSVSEETFNPVVDISTYTIGSGLFK